MFLDSFLHQMSTYNYTLSCFAPVVLVCCVTSSG